MLEGVRLVLDQGQKIKPTARELGLNYKTLGRYVALKRNSINIDNKQFGYSKVHKRILNDEQEQMLADYLIQANRIYYGLTKIEFRTLHFRICQDKQHTYTNFLEEKPDGKQRLGLSVF
ncbi:hypothetical protein RRG08_007068 [Elysia crispata]|uniref:Uncharacterized protein n=1 Tax=Elysia crispata TaxID=231223 RepID=A0AAE1DW27_9GAST|nr:hypothetical protein RRG08_007068 [Elysia crispata]